MRLGPIVSIFCIVLQVIFSALDRKSNTRNTFSSSLLVVVVLDPGQVIAGGSSS